MLSAMERLAAVGLKRTPQRVALLEMLEADRSHPTAQDLFQRLRAQMPTISFATVYNTLRALTTSGLCVTRQLDPGAARFDGNTIPHDHAVCDRCGGVFDVTSTATGPVAGNMAASPLPAGFSVAAIERVFRGTCAGCQSASRQSASRQSASRQSASRQSASHDPSNFPSSSDA